MNRFFKIFQHYAPLCVFFRNYANYALRAELCDFASAHNSGRSDNGRNARNVVINNDNATNESPVPIILWITKVLILDVLFCTYLDTSIQFKCKHSYNVLDCRLPSG